MRRRSIWIATALVTAGIAPTLPQPARAASVAPDFTDTAVASFAQPTTVERLPDDRIVVLEQAGRLRVAPPGASFTTAVELDGVCRSSERGLLGFAHDPAFLGNGLVYVYYTRVAPSAPGGCVNRVSRFQMVGDSIDPATEFVLLDNISSVNGNHNGGDLDIGSDGFLYVSTGDAGRDPRGDSGSAGGNDAAQDTSLLNGKILRVTRDGRPAPGNPFSGAGSAECRVRGNTPATPTTSCREIYAWGLRNPFRIAFDRNDGSDRFFINDVGQGTFEEVNDGALGADYGWPAREGACPQGQSSNCAPPPAGVTDPITAYGRSLGTYVTAGAFVPDGLWPEQYDGGYLFADGGTGTMWIRTATGDVDYGSPFASGLGSVVDMTFGFDESGATVLYYVTSGGALRAIGGPAGDFTPPSDDLAYSPALSPSRVYDTGDGTGVAAGDVFNGATRRVTVPDCPGSDAALVNLTLAATAGPGFVRTWATRTDRPGTSSINADTSGSFVANAMVVPLDDDGAFMLEASTTGRVIVDLMGCFSPASGTVDDGRLVPLDPRRIADTREPSGDPNDPAATNVFEIDGDTIHVHPFGPDGQPAGEPAGAVVLSIGAIAGPGPGGYVSAYQADQPAPDTSNVNVVAGDVRANMVVVGLDPSGTVALDTLNVDDVVVDLVGYFTADGASASESGLFSFVDPVRTVDTRRSLGFGRLGAMGTGTVGPPTGSVGAVVQNVTVTGTSGPGWVSTYPAGTSLPNVSSLNFTGPGQTRAALAFTKASSSGTSYTSLVPTDVVTDVIGTFSP